MLRGRSALQIASDTTCIGDGDDKSVQQRELPSTIKATFIAGLAKKKFFQEDQSGLPSGRPIEKMDSVIGFQSVISFFASS